MEQQFTKYEIARIIGARALQIAMDAPLLLKFSEQELKDLKYDALRISQREFEEGVLPISINRPSPQKKKEKLKVIKEVQVSDEELAQKEKEVEKEIVENPDEYSLVQDDAEEVDIAPTAEEQ
jgi:DNA-directed RNA polymerase subunit K